jgi:hypothetical protein
MFKWAFWLGLIALAVLIGSKLIPVYYMNLKIQNVFQGIVENSVRRSVSEIKVRAMEILEVQGVEVLALPDSFLKNLVINESDGKILIKSKYHIVVWFLGAPQSVNPDEEYAEKDVAPMDKLRLRARMDIDFAPHAETP